MLFYGVFKPGDQREYIAHHTAGHSAQDGQHKICHLCPAFVEINLDHEDIHQIQSDDQKIYQPKNGGLFEILRKGAEIGFQNRASIIVQQVLGDFIVGSDGTNLKLGVMPDGSFETKVSPSVDYIFLATCKGYLNTNNQLTTDTITTDYQYVLQFPLSSTSIPVLVRNVFFEFDKADITPESATALERLVTMLNDNPSITIELSAHTDSRGNDQYNQRLSQRRAEAVVNYLISKGIETERLTPVGYGESMPKVVNRKLTETHAFLKEGDVLSDDFINQLTPEQQDSCHALNRRTQFRVLRTTYTKEVVPTKND